MIEASQTFLWVRSRVISRNYPPVMRMTADTTSEEGASVRKPFETTVQFCSKSCSTSCGASARNSWTKLMPPTSRGPRANQHKPKPTLIEDRAELLKAWRREPVSFVDGDQRCRIRDRHLPGLVRLKMYGSRRALTEEASPAYSLDRSGASGFPNPARRLANWS